MNSIIRFVIGTVLGLGSVMVVPQADAAIVTFDFTGRMTVFFGGVYSDNPTGQTPIAAQLSIDTNNLLGGSNLHVTVDNFSGSPVTFYDMKFTGFTATNNRILLDGSFLADWKTNKDMGVHVLWDVQGLYNAINFGLQAGDKISGNEMSRDTDGDGIADTVVIANLGSGTPRADGFSFRSYPNYLGDQIYAPMAAVAGTQGFTSGPFVDAATVWLDIGSGHSMTVTSVSAVPVPAAVWLFGSGLIGLIGFARRPQVSA